MVEAFRLIDRRKLLKDQVLVIPDVHGPVLMPEALTYTGIEIIALLLHLSAEGSVWLPDLVNRPVAVDQLRDRICRQAFQQVIRIISIVFKNCSNCLCL